MLNIKEVKQDIVDSVTQMLCAEYGLDSKEVKVWFDSSGHLKATIVPRSFLDKLSLDYVVVRTEE